MSDEQKQLNKARQALVDRILSRLDAGAMPWDNGMKGIAAPRNAVSGTHYRGMNLINLLLTSYERGLSDPRWLTFNQATEADYKVKKGAKGVPIELYKTIDKRTGKDADLAKIREEIKDMTFGERQAFKKENLQSFARSYYVFNASDVVGIEPYKAPELTSADIAARNERIEAAIAASAAPIFYDGRGRNYYDPMLDEIHLTERSAFTSDEFFYNTALHEMAHSTGHGSRLNRPDVEHFGTPSYAREELVAELSSVLTAAEFGLDHSDRVIENSAEYVRSWAQLIRDNPQTLIDATFDASRATDYICERARQREHEQEREEHEYKALKIVLNNVRNNVDMPENITFQDIDYLIPVGELVVKYGGEKTHVGYAITDTLEQKFDELSEKWEKKTQKESNRAKESQLYDRYTTAQAKHPEAVVVMRIGDFYEVMGDKAKTVADELDLTLTSRNVGQAERVPMCGFPFHVAEQYLEKILDRHSVTVVDDDVEEKYTQSHSEAQKTPLENLVFEEKTQKGNNAKSPQQHNKPLMVNFYAGPSAGKSVAALELTAALKKAGYNVEYVSEFAKDLVLEGRTDELKNQQFVTDGQYQRFDRIRNSTDIIVTDSPVLLGLVYGKYNGISEEYAKQIRGYYDSFDNFNMLMTRPKGTSFQQEGRVHDENQSIQLDGEIKSMLDTQGVFYGSYKRDDIAKTVERIGTTFARLYGKGKEEKTQKESAVTSKAAPPATSSPVFKTDLDNIPDAMKALPNWVAFRTEQADGKVKKILLSPNKGASSVEYLKWAKSDDPTTWATFDKAVAFAKKYKLNGLAFAMGGSGMTCIDLDHHLDENGKPTELARKFIDAAQGTYIERSVSGRGLHIFYAGARPNNRQNRNIDLDLETYDSARFMSMTGDLYGNAPKEINPPSDALKNVLASNLSLLQTYSAPSMPLGMDDSALVEKIRSSKRGYEFDELMRGVDICGDHSVSDFKLCNMLAFFSGGDAAQVERIFKSSGLYRPKKGDAYVKRTAEKACSTLTKTYQPKSNTQKKNGSKPSGRSGSGQGSSGR